MTDADLSETAVSFSAVEEADWHTAKHLLYRALGHAQNGAKCHACGVEYNGRSFETVEHEDRCWGVQIDALLDRVKDIGSPG